MDSKGGEYQIEKDEETKAILVYDVIFSNLFVSTSF